MKEYNNFKQDDREIQAAQGNLYEKWVPIGTGTRPTVRLELKLNHADQFLLLPAHPEKL